MLDWRMQSTCFKMQALVAEPIASSRDRPFYVYAQLQLHDRDR